MTNPSRVLLVAALLLGAGLAGCVGGDESAGGDEIGSTTSGKDVNASSETGVGSVGNGTTAPSPRFTLSACSMQGAMLPMPEDAVAGALPPGFEPVGIDLGLGVGAGAMVAALAVDCEDANGTGQAQRALVAFAVVDPPPAYEANVSSYAIPLVAYVDGEPLADRLEAWDLGRVVDASVTLIATDAGPNGRAGTIHVDTGAMQLAATVDAAGSPGAASNWTIRTFGVSDDRVTGAFNLTIHGGQFLGPGPASYGALAPGLSPPPADGGLGVHQWGEDHGYVLERVPLTENTSEAQDGSGSSSPSPVSDGPLASVPTAPAKAMFSPWLSS